MREVKKRYRKDYQGEEVVVNMELKGTQWETQKEFVPNSVTNTQISNQACIIGNGISRKDFNLNAIFGHHGGLLGRKKLQTYGCNALYREHQPDFLIAAGDDGSIITEIAESGYCDNHVVYASTKYVQPHPGKFYIIPQDPGWNAGSVATYLACFDGHTKIFLIGFDGQDTENYSYNMYAGTNGYQRARNAQADPGFLDLTMKHVFDVYDDVEFVRVMPTKNSFVPESWKFCKNFRQVSFREFILEADL